MSQIDNTMMDLDELKSWLNDNLLRASEAQEITGQSKDAFMQ